METMDYTEVAAFDLQQYIDSLTDEEKVSRFKLLGNYLQEKEADVLWLKDHDSYPYTPEFMAWYVSEKYVAFVEQLFSNPEVDDATAEIVFTYQNGKQQTVETISNWMSVPYDYLLKMTMKSAGIDPAKVKGHLLVD